VVTAAVLDLGAGVAAGTRYKTIDGIIARNKKKRLESEGKTASIKEQLEHQKQLHAQAGQPSLISWDSLKDLDVADIKSLGRLELTDSEERESSAIGKLRMQCAELEKAAASSSSSSSGHSLPMYVKEYQKAVQESEHPFTMEMHDKRIRLIQVLSRDLHSQLMTCDFFLFFSLRPSMGSATVSCELSRGAALSHYSSIVFFT
jgi:hypothetical protein